MQKNIGAYVGWTAVVAAIVIMILAVRNSPSYQECKTETQVAQSSGQQQEDASSQFFGVPVIWRCTGHFIDKNDPVITALATTVIAIFTIVLVIVSNRQARLYAQSDSFFAWEPELPIHLSHRRQLRRR
jgi:hypothetical protein